MRITCAWRENDDGELDVPINSPEDVRRVVEIIRRNDDNDENMHSWEDDLYEEVLRAVASGALGAREMAVEALKTQEIEFSRWKG